MENTNELLARLAALEAANATLKAKLEAKTPVKPITFKVSEKGALSAYGFGRFPVTLYKSQWTRLIEVIDAVKQALQDNAALLKEKE